jgi:glucose/arabinose dehydrogenase
VNHDHRATTPGNPFRRGVATFALALIAGAAAHGAPQAEIVIGGVRYERLATREATLERMLDLLTPDVGSFGKWYVLSPLPYAGHGKNDLARALEPEGELERLTAGGPGMQLDRTFAGKQELVLRWEEVDVQRNSLFDLRRHGSTELHDESIAYLYTTIECATARTADVLFGSDDGARVWLNGKLILDVDVPRGMDPASDPLKFDLAAGTNHLLIKVANGASSWEFQLSTRKSLPIEVDSHLYWQLDKDFPPSRASAHYRVLPIASPDDVALEVGGLAIHRDGRPLVATRRGDVYLVDGAYDDPPLAATFTKFASGLHEPLGLASREEDGEFAVYTMQRGELTRLVDHDGDGRADEYGTFADDFGVSGNYHEFAFGPAFDAAGNAYVTLNVGFCGSLGKSLVPWRGFALRVDPSGAVTPLCDGLRSPNGFAFGPGDVLFYVDNQGDYVATNRLSALLPGSWHGHPASLRWRQDFTGEDRPPRQPPAVWFPYKKMGQSVADVEYCRQNGRFGPFDGQIFVGDQLAANVMRVHLEEVDGHWQGACFPFLEGFGCGVNRLEFAPDGSLLVGETDRGWPSIGRRRHGLERIVYTGEMPFEIRAMKAREDGFELEFTTDVDLATATDIASYTLVSYTYPYHSDYGAPEVETAPLTIESIEALDRKRVRITASPLRRDFVHELVASGVRNAAGEPLLHDVAYYTLVNVPGRDNRRDDAALPEVLVYTPQGERHEVGMRPQEATLSRVEIQIVEALRGRYRARPSQDPARLTDEALQDVAAIVLFGSEDAPLTSEQAAALRRYVAAGGGLALIHAAPLTIEDDVLARDLAGIDRAATPRGEALEPASGDVEILGVDLGHPANSFLSSVAGDAPSFIVDDRPARFALDPLVAHPLLAANLEGESRSPLAWWKDCGEGRIFATALGHRDDAWKEGALARHVAAGVDFVAGNEDAPPSPPQGAIVLLPVERGAANELAAHFRDPRGARALIDDHGLAIEIAPGNGDLETTLETGSGRYHLEFQVPASPPDAKGQERGNSGVFLLGRYEIQILDSHGLPPSPVDCGALYGVAAPSTAATRPALRWQSLDVQFEAPAFDANGIKTRDASATVHLNGVRIHDRVAIPTPTGAAHGAAESVQGPLRFQDHGHPVRFRNIWFVPAD